MARGSSLPVEPHSEKERRKIQVENLLCWHLYPYLLTLVVAFDRGQICSQEDGNLDGKPLSFPALKSSKKKKKGEGENTRKGRAEYMPITSRKNTDCFAG